MHATAEYGDEFQNMLSPQPDFSMANEMKLTPNKMSEYLQIFLFSDAAADAADPWTLDWVNICPDG